LDLLLLLIKKSTSLIHLNLSDTGLSEQHLMLFGKALRRSRFLQAIHLSGN